MEIGKPIKRPPISKNLTPGGWTALHDKSPFIISATEFTLDHMSSSLGINIPSDVKIHLFAAGGQIVSGINTYLEFRILGDSPRDVQVLVYDAAFTKGHDHTMEIQGLYVTSSQIFK